MYRQTPKSYSYHKLYQFSNYREMCNWKQLKRMVSPSFAYLSRKLVSTMQLEITDTSTCLIRLSRLNLNQALQLSFENGEIARSRRLLTPDTLSNNEKNHQALFSRRLWGSGVGETAAGRQRKVRTFDKKERWKLGKTEPTWKLCKQLLQRFFSYSISSTFGMNSSPRISKTFLGSF